MLDLVDFLVLLVCPVRLCFLRPPTGLRSPSAERWQLGIWHAFTSPRITNTCSNNRSFFVHSFPNPATSGRARVEPSQTSVRSFVDFFNAISTGTSPHYPSAAISDSTIYAALSRHGRPIPPANISDNFVRSRIISSHPSTRWRRASTSRCTQEGLQFDGTALSDYHSPPRSHWGFYHAVATMYEFTVCITANEEQSPAILVPLWANT